MFSVRTDDSLADPLIEFSCADMQIAVATSKRNQGADGSKKLGLQWSVPLLLGTCKEGEDRNRIQCMVFDFVIHPDTCRMAMNNARYKVRPQNA